MFTLYIWLDEATIKKITYKQENINCLSVIGIAVVNHEGTGNANADRKYEVHLKDIFKVIV